MQECIGPIEATATRVTVYQNETFDSLVRGISFLSAQMPVV